MPDLTSLKAASVAGRDVTLGELLYNLKLSRQLGVLKDALRPAILRASAERHGVSVGDDELQVAADQFRQMMDLSTAERTDSWLGQNDLSVDDLETHIENLVLERKLATKVVGGDVEQYFEGHKESFDEAGLTSPVRERIEKHLFNDWLREEVETLGVSLTLGGEGP